MPASQTAPRSKLRTVYFATGVRWRAAAIRTLLGEACPELRCEQVRRVMRVEYLDTFDWLLLRASRVAERRQFNGSRQLVFRAAHAAPRRAPQPVSAGIVRAQEVRGRFLRAELTRLCGERSLLPVVAVTRKSVSFTLRDVAGKQRLRVHLREERNEVGTRPATRVRVALVPLAGYSSEASAVRAALLHRGWEPAEEPLLEALRVAGRQPLDYPPPAAPALVPEMPARDAFARIGLRQLDVMEANLDGLRADVDVEFLHDFRVALRRTRTLLAQIREVLPAPRVRRFKAEFRWLGTVSGAARDGDVQVEEIAQLVASRPQAEREALQPLQAWIGEQREQARAALLKALASARCRHLLEDWRRLLEQSPPRTRLANAARPIGEVAAQRVQALFNQLIEKGSQIDDDSPPTHLHELRKDAKKLRYLIEFFRPLYEPSRVDVLVGDLKQLQENLGEYQDLDVQRGLLVRFAVVAPAHTVSVLEGLAASMHARELKVRAEFAGRFKAFSAPRVRRHLRAMLNGGKSAGGR